MTLSNIYVILNLFILSTVFAVPDTPAVALPFIPLAEKSEVYLLPELPYGLADLEPFIDEATVKAHYLGHHNAYREKMNVLFNEFREKDPINHFSTDPPVDVLRRIDEVPDFVQQKLKNNLGGFVNHALYWGVLSPNPEAQDRIPSGSLLEEIENSFGNYFAFKAEFTQEALNFFGSGYVWLVKNPAAEPGSRLSIITTKNQDSPISQDLDPLLVIDVWEHAYYLKHQFRRAKHVEDWWLLVDWKNVEALDKFWDKVRAPKEEVPLTEAEEEELRQLLEQQEQEADSKEPVNEEL